MQKRYVIIESHKSDSFEEVLPLGTDPGVAIDKTYLAWNHITKSERDTVTVELAVLTYDEEAEELVLEQKDCPEGWECLAAYTPLVRFENWC